MTHLDHAADPFRCVRGHQDIAEAADLVLLHDCVQIPQLGLGLGRLLGEVALHAFGNEGQAFSRLQLADECQSSLCNGAVRVVDEHQQLGPPVPRVLLLRVHVEQGEPGGRETQAADAVAPFLLGSCIFNVFVDGGPDEDGQQGEVPGGDEHDRDAEEGTEHGQGPVEVAEAGTPAGGLEQGLEGTGRVDPEVAHQEELGDKGRDVLDDGDQDAAPADE